MAPVIDLCAIYSNPYRRPKAVAEIQRLVREEGEVKLSIGENQIAFELNRSLLVSKLIEGNYPNYRQVIPSEAKERIKLERETFLTAVRRASLLASEKSIKLIFTKSIGHFII